MIPHTALMGQACVVLITTLGMNINSDYIRVYISMYLELSWEESHGAHSDYCRGPYSAMTLSAWD